MSWVISSKKRETERVRAEDWPEDAFAIIYAKVTAGDQELITELTYHAHLVSSDEKGNQELRTDFALHRAAIATAAVMLVAVEGEAFEDPDTGEPLNLSGDLTKRLDQIRRLPHSIIQFIDQKVGDSNADPLAQKRDVPASESASKRRSTKS